MQKSLINFFKLNIEKIIVMLILPILAVLTLFSGFIFDEILGMGGSTISNTIYSLANHIYLFILLPFNFVDDTTPSIRIKLVLILTIIWWYFLSCMLISLKKNTEKIITPLIRPTMRSISFRAWERCALFLSVVGTSNNNQKTTKPHRFLSPNFGLSQNINLSKQRSKP